MEHIKDVAREAIEYCKLIKPTNWSHKTEAIDFNPIFFGLMMSP